MKNVCLVDLDDTLADFRTPMIEIVNRVTGKDTKWEGYDIPDDAGLTHAEFIDILIKEDIISKIGINDSSRKFLNDLHKLGYYTVLITARGWHPYGRALTQQWVAEHELDINELIVVDAHQSKTDVITKFGGDIVFSIDDRIKHCREYSQSGNVDHVLLYDAIWNSKFLPWNTDWNGCDYEQRIYDLHEIIDHVEWSKENQGAISRKNSRKRRSQDVRKVYS